MNIGILGGGLSGLSAGFFLHQKNIDFEILEKSDSCGGLCKSIEQNGFTFDVAGGHIIFSKDKEIFDLMLDLLGENKLMNKRNTKILYKDRFVKYPFENGLADLPEEENKECLEEFKKTLDQKFSEPKNFKEWIYQTFGKGIAEKYLIPYNIKIWNFPLEKMATFWIADRVPKPPVEDIIKSSQGIETEGYTHQLYFYYPKKGGIQALTDAIRAKIKDRITENFEIKSVIRNNGKWIVSNGKQQKTYDRLISTIPIFHLIDAINVPKNIREAAKNLRYNSLVVMAIGLDKKNLLPYHWLYLPDRNIKVHRIIFLSNYSPNMAPEGKFCIMAEMIYNEGDRISEMNEKELKNYIIDSLHERKIINKNDICYTNIAKSKYAYVIYDIDYEKNMKIIEEFFKSVGIILCGRFSEFKYLNMDACIRSAMNVVSKLEMIK